MTPAESDPPDRVVDVPPERLTRWVANFTERHGDPELSADDRGLALSAPDGAQARLLDPSPPFAPDGDPVAALVAKATTPRLTGVLLVRRGGWAVGLFEGTALVRSKVGRSYVQAQTKAGGWSQQRFARRRANQADQLYAAAADATLDVLLPITGTLVSVVGGGDAPGVQAVLADRRLARLAALLDPRIRPTVDPRLKVLTEFGARLQDVRIELNSLA